MYVVFCILLIYVLFFILGIYYLIIKNRINNIVKYILIFIYCIILIVLNVGVLSIFSYNYSKKININKLDILTNEINTLKYEIEYNNTILKDVEDRILYKENLLVELDELRIENNLIKRELYEKNNEYEKLKNDLNRLNKEYNLLYKKSKFIIDDFPTYNQFPNYPNGCESVALNLLLKYNGIDVSVESIVEKLKKGDRPFRKNGKLYGGDPIVEFVGDPRSKNGYGVYEKPIIEVAEYYKSGIKNITGKSLDEVLKIVETGKPVQVWASIKLHDTYVCSTWTATSTGRKINWLCGLHSLVIIGFTYDKIIVSDPYTGKIEYYDKIQFEKIYNIYGKRAIYYE